LSTSKFQNAQIFAELREVTPGGVNSPFRAFHHVEGQPPIIERGEGCYLYDVEGSQYIDLCCAWGPVVLGHNHPAVSQAVIDSVTQGPIFGAPTRWELDCARAVRIALPSMEQVRFVNSGAEAVASSLRVARGVTRRARILKFEGGYHGHVECLDSAGAEAEEMGGPLALGASPGAAHETLVATYNDLASVRALFSKYPREIAAIIVEPVTGSMGVIVPDPGFLEGLQEICRANGSLLIFDEVLTGFRVDFGGAQKLLQVQPDLTCLGKALAGGLPIGAYGGRRDLMEQVAPQGTIYQAGTFCGNPISMRASIACLQELSRDGFYAELARLTARLVQGLAAISPKLVVQHTVGMFSIHIGKGEIHSHKDLANADRPAFSRFHAQLLKRKVYLPPSCLDAACITAAHTDEVIDTVVELAEHAFKESQG
jgi:glutamate-1-semialdehyde 2,1-aminomutase